MAFSSEWEKTYKSNLHQSIWPWSDLVSYVMRYSRPKKKNFRVLELGCGAGANIPFFKWLGVDYCGVDGSTSVIKMLQAKFPELKNKLKTADFTQEIPFRGKFDLIIDRASLTHNSTQVIKKCISEIVNPALASGGKFIGIDWFSTEHDDYKKIKVKNSSDPYSIEKFDGGQFEGIGLVHFADKKLIEKFFSNFDIQILEHKIYKQEIPDKHTFASWNFLAVKE